MRDGTWRLLFHQYTLRHALNNKTEPCPPASEVGRAGPDPSVAVVGGYARSTTHDILGPWEYNYWHAAYSMQPEWAVSPAKAPGFTAAAAVAPPALTARERPKLLLDADGYPSWLSNGVCLDAPGGGRRDCFTFAQRITPP